MRRHRLGKGFSRSGRFLVCLGPSCPAFPQALAGFSLGQVHVIFALTLPDAGDLARLDRRRLWLSWGLWRGVFFVLSRSGRAAKLLDALWQERLRRYCL
jgi:hypothetical protein